MRCFAYDIGLCGLLLLLLALIFNWTELMPAGLILFGFALVLD